MLGLVKPFMSKKLRERTHLYGGDTTRMLVEAGLSPEAVPPEYGGTLEDFDPAWWLSDSTPLLSSCSGDYRILRAAPACATRSQPGTRES